MKASEEMKNNEAIVMAATRSILLVHSLICKAIVMAAVQQDGGALEHASEGMQNSRSIVMLAVRENGKVFKHASEEMKNDREIVMAAMRGAKVDGEFNAFHMKNIFAAHVPSSMKDDEAVVIEALRISKHDEVRKAIFVAASERLQRNERVRGAAGV